MAICRGHHCAGNQPVAVVAQRVAHEAQFSGRVALAVEQCIRIGARLVGVIAAALALEVARVIVAAIAGFENLVPGPGLDQRAVHAEVLATEPVVLIGNRKHLVEQCDHRVMLNQALAVLGKHRRHPNRVIHRQADEPTKQQVVLRLLHQQALRTNAVEGLAAASPATASQAQCSDARL